MTDVSLLRCTNKACQNQGYHKLDVAKDEVICLECSKPIDVTPYMKKTLASNKQILEEMRTSGGGIRCPFCDVIDDPVLFDFGKDKRKMPVIKAGCGHCKTPNPHLSKFFIKALELNPTTRRIVVKDSPVEENTTKSQPKSAQDMLNRVGMKYTGNVKEQESVVIDEEEPKRLFKRAEDSSNKRPKTAQEMLERAGVAFKTLPSDDDGKDDQL